VGKDRLKMKDFFEKLDKANVVPVFGLEAQGHIPAIEEILKDLESYDYAWDKIAKQIGWCDKAARNHYIAYLMERGQKANSEKSNCTIDSVNGRSSFPHCWGKMNWILKYPIGMEPRTSICSCRHGALKCNLLTRKAARNGC
jgi:hypothetical protein